MTEIQLPCDMVPPPGAPVPAALLETALRVVHRAWAPHSPLPGDPEPAADDDDCGDDGCGCGGETGDGRPLCNCGGGCQCDGCAEDAHARTAYCQAGQAHIGTHCWARAQYRVVAYRLWPHWVAEDRPEGAACPHTDNDSACMCTDSTVYVAAGMRPGQHRYASACSVAHAQALTDHMVTVDAQTYADDPRRLRTYIERWTYVPSASQLPDHLAGLRRYIDAAAATVPTLITDWSRRGTLAEFWLQNLRSLLALAVWHAGHPEPDPEPEPDPDDGLTAPQEEPPEYYEPDA
ncbi:hypothetical protein ABVG11_34380 [Streptomyces sp. HD1123-B1]|uniref:hypothetical protein n=1 Tax=Streptomyces huangiella TaxID=3228804 RepID=UPI003D7E01A8